VSAELAVPVVAIESDNTVVIGGRRFPAEVDNYDMAGSGYDFRERRARIKFENGWTLSIVWGTGSYSTNRGCGIRSDQEFVEEATSVEIAAWPIEGGMIEWPEGDTVRGWQSVDDVLRLIIDMQTWATERAS
jgi:hypothetical protein